jgi:hypothetical protein
MMLFKKELEQRNRIVISAYQSQYNNSTSQITFKTTTYKENAHNLFTL